MADPRAGQPAAPGDLVNVAKLVTAYYTVHPDPGDVAQRVSFGTSGHRGSAFTATFNEDHILATTQAICEYRASQGIDGPLYLGADTHALSEPAQASALEVLAANGVRVLTDSRGGYTPTPAVSRAILAYNASGDGPQADGIVVTPSHNPPADGGFKYNPPDGGPAGTDVTKVIQDRANELLADGLRGVRRVPYAKAVAADTTGTFDFLGSYVAALDGVVDLAAIRGRRNPHRRRPARRRERRVLGRDRRALRPRPHRGQPRGGPDLPVHDPGLGRQDPDGLLVAVRDGQPDPPPARLHDRDGQRHRLRPARHRHAGRGAAQPQPLPRGRHRLPVPAPERLAGSRGGRQDAGQLVDDRPGDGRPRPERCSRCPSGSSGSCPACSTARWPSAARRARGPRSCSATGRCGRPTRTGSSWRCSPRRSPRSPARRRPSSTPASPSATARPSTPGSTRPPPASRRRHSAGCRRSRSRPASWPARRSSATLTTAPGNGAPIGGLKVVTESGWFAARPSGTEDVYKLYAESFRGAGAPRRHPGRGPRHRRRRHRRLGVPEGTPRGAALLRFLIISGYV